MTNLMVLIIYKTCHGKQRKPWVSTFLYIEGYGGVLVGQCVKLPGLIGRG